VLDKLAVNSHQQLHPVGLVHHHRRGVMEARGSALFDSCNSVTVHRYNIIEGHAGFARETCGKPQPRQVCMHAAEYQT